MKREAKRAWRRAEVKKKKNTKRGWTAREDLNPNIRTKD